VQKQEHIYKQRKDIKKKIKKIASQIQHTNLKALIEGSSKTPRTITALSYWGVYLRRVKGPQLGPQWRRETPVSQTAVRLTNVISPVRTQRNFFEILSTQTQSIFWLIWSSKRTRPFDVSNQSVHGKYNLISVWFSKISKIFLCVNCKKVNWLPVRLASLGIMGVQSKVPLKPLNKSPKSLFYGLTWVWCSFLYNV